MSNEPAEMEMAFSFPDQSASFVHGYEAGKLDARMEAGESVIDCGCSEGFPLHEENIDLVQRMAAFYGYKVTIEGSSDGWANVFLEHSPRPKPTLRIVP